LTATLDGTFTALADPTRRAILARLARGEATVSDLKDPFPMSLPALLKHVEVLERAGLVRSRKEGRVRRCALEAKPLEEATAWMCRYRAFWEKRFDALDRYLRDTPKEDPCPPPKAPPALRAPSPSARAASSRRRASGSSGRSWSRRR
jgi:DNA-binding transcriptional ArsR family regulator